jgi:hypothetical protein
VNVRQSGSWPEGNDPVARELRLALNEAHLRGPDDMTLRRGWAALAGRLRPPGPRRWPYFAGGVASAAALALAAAAWLWPRSMETPGFSPARTAPKIAAASGTVTSTPTGRRRLTLEGGVEAELDVASVMHIDGGDPRVMDGEVRFSVPHRPPGHPFVVRAERYRVIVVGTKFGVRVEQQGSARQVAVDVDEGVVEVWGSERLARLSPGESWRSNDPSAQGAPAAAAEDNTDEPMPALVHRSSGHARELALRSPGERRERERTSEPGEAPAPTSPTAAARNALAAGDPARALQIYRAMAAKGTGPSAENASYEIGKVLSERMAQPASAIAAWRRYRADYPDGILRVEADVSIIETLVHSGDTDEALGEAVAFLRRYPESERRAEIARLAGDLYRSRGDCRRALVAYQMTLSAPRVARDVAEEATFNRASCYARIGDSANAAETARVYLRTFPNGRYRGQAASLADKN